MRFPIALLLLLATLPAIAQELELDLGVRGVKRVERGLSVTFELALPVDQLRFVDDGSELVATYSVQAVSGEFPWIVLEPRRVTAPRGTTPQGTVTARLDVTVDSGVDSFQLIVRDETTKRTGTRRVTLEGTAAIVEVVDDPAAADARWRETLARAEAEKKPIVVFFRTRPCARCSDFERLSLPHPLLQRRLPHVVVAVLPVTVGDAAKLWSSPDPGVALFDRSGVLRARWPLLPDTTSFGIILDSVIAVAPHLERAVQLGPHEGEIDIANALFRLGRPNEARAALLRAREHGSAATKQAAIVSMAALDAKERKGGEWLRELQQIVATPANANVAADAWMTLGTIHRGSGATDQAIRAFTAVTELSDVAPGVHAAAQKALDGLRATNAPAERGAIRLLPLTTQLVVGKQTLRTHVASANVARVVFFVDGREVRRVERPPFSTRFDFGELPERRTIRVVAYDRRGQEIGLDERAVNDAGEAFGLRLLSPRDDAASGAVRVTMSVRVPPARTLRRVVLSWNDAERAVLTSAPWEATVSIPHEQVGVLRAVAELDDGRSSEDAVLLNAGGSDRANVQLVELPITVASRTGTTPAITADRIVVREGKTRRRVESVATAAETPLTVGLLIDVSDSTQKTLPDVQEAAIRFLGTVLGERDRAFLVTFTTSARLVQAATSDRALLRRKIMAIRPEGLTALHDAMVLGLLQFEGIKGRRAMIVFSDGVDRTSRYRAEDVSELARRVNVPVHVIVSTPGMPATLQENGERRVAAGWLPEPPDPGLKRVVQATGGTSHALDSLTALPAVYARIEAALRAQILAFVRTDPGTRENEWRAIQVEVRGEDLDAFAPEGYYAPW